MELCYDKNEKGRITYLVISYVMFFVMLFVMPVLFININVFAAEDDINNDIGKDTEKNTENEEGGKVSVVKPTGKKIKKINIPDTVKINGQK